MKIAKIAAFALSAALFGAMNVAPASAATAITPSAVKAATQKAGGIELIQRKRYRDGRRVRDRRGSRHRYRAGQRLRSAPRGYRRYDRRPSFWRTRGCVVVGPVWFCP